MKDLRVTPRVAHGFGHNHALQMSILCLRGFTMLELLLAMAAMAVLIIGTLQLSSQMVINVDTTQALHTMAQDVSSAAFNFQTRTENFPTAFQQLIDQQYLPAEWNQKMPAVTATIISSADNRRCVIRMSNVPKYAGKVVRNVLPYELFYSENTKELTMTLYKRRSQVFANADTINIQLSMGPTAAETYQMPDELGTTTVTVYSQLMAITNSPQVTLAGHQQLVVKPPTGLQFQYRPVKGSILNPYNPILVPENIPYGFTGVFSVVLARPNGGVAARFEYGRVQAHPSVTRIEYNSTKAPQFSGTPLVLTGAEKRFFVGSVPAGEYILYGVLDGTWQNQGLDVQNCGYTSVALGNVDVVLF